MRGLIAVLLVVWTAWMGMVSGQSVSRDDMTVSRDDMTVSSWFVVEGSNMASKAAVLHSASGRAFFFGSGTPSTVYEFLLPAQGNMTLVGSTTIPVSPNTAFIQLNSSDTSPTSPYDIYVGASGSVHRYTVTPGAQPSIMSTMVQTASVVVPGPVYSIVMANDYLYVSLGALDTGLVTRIPLNNFTTAYVQEHESILFPGEPFLQFATFDGLFVYYGSAQTPNVYRVDSQSYSLDRQINLTTTYGSKGSFIDTARGLLYFVSGGKQNSLNKINISNFVQIEESVEFDSFVNTKVVLHDVYGGHAYFGLALSPGVVSHVNLQASTLKPTLYFRTEMEQIETGVLDATNNYAYFGIKIGSNFAVVKVQVPLPCTGMYSNISDTSSDNCSSPNGYCEYATCNCYHDSGYEGPACSDRRCVDDCFRDAANNTDGMSHGECYDGTCVCAAEFNGTDCSIRQCKNECMRRGTCSGAPDYKCDCPTGWTGDDCSERVIIPPCYEMDSCGDCNRNTSCGWCESSKKCVDGDAFGPLFSLCERYNYNTCPSIFYFSFGYILTIICWVFMVVSAILTVWQDYNLPANTKTQRFVQGFWWRNQLSAKIWQLVDYIQLLAITGYLAVDMPPSYLEFILPFQWSIFHLPYPFSSSSVIRPPTAENDNSFFVQGRVVASAAEEVFLGNLFFYAIMIAALFVLFVLPVYIVASCTGDSSTKKENLSNMSKRRSVYSLIRLNQFAHLPLTVTALFTIIWYSHTASHSSSFTASFALSVIVLILLGLVMPVVTFLKVYGKEKELFSAAFSMKFGSLYQKYHFRKGFFTTIQFAKTLLIAIWIGILYQHPVPQLAYFIIVMVGRPHADHIHFFTELVVAVLEVIMFLLFLGFRNHSEANGWAVGVVVVHILTISVIVVGICSTLFKMNGIAGVRDLRQAVAGKDKDRSSTSESRTGLQREHRVDSEPNLSS